MWVVMGVGDVSGNVGSNGVRDVSGNVGSNGVRDVSGNVGNGVTSSWQQVTPAYPWFVVTETKVNS